MDRLYRMHMGALDQPITQKDEVRMKRDVTVAGSTGVYNGQTYYLSMVESKQTRYNLEEYIKKNFPNQKFNMKDILVIIHHKKKGWYARGFTLDEILYFVEIKGDTFPIDMLNDGNDYEIIRDNIEQKLSKLRMAGKLA